MNGRAVQIVTMKEDLSFELDVDALHCIVDKDQVGDKHLAIVSIAGNYHTGKSLLLNYFLHFLKANGSPDWFESENSRLTGFPWGSDLNFSKTPGILAWSELFTVTTSVGDQIAVLLLDYNIQETECTSKECALVSALSIMTSSIHIYSVCGSIDGVKLRDLQLAVNDCAAALDDYDCKFQKLQFLVRDWNQPYKFAYGSQDGKTYLSQYFSQSGNEHSNNGKTVRKDLWSSFTDISCFLMPRYVDRGEDLYPFSGQLADSGPNFRTQLQNLIPLLLSPDNLVIKEIGGKAIRAKELTDHLQYFVAALNRKTARKQPVYSLTTPVFGVELQPNEILALLRFHEEKKQEIQNMLAEHRAKYKRKFSSEKDNDSLCWLVPFCAIAPFLVGGCLLLKRFL